MDTESYIKMMSIFIESAKQCTQLAIAALILPVFFLRNILGVPANEALRPHLNGWLIGSWLCLGISILLGFLYQIAAATQMANALMNVPQFPGFPRLQQLQFLLMVGSLIAGLALFIVGSFRR